MNKKVKFVVLFLVVVVIVTLLFNFIVNNKYIDTVKYDGKTYVLLEYNEDVFTYYHNSNNYYEEDIIHPVTHNKWKVVHFNGDLFILDKDVKDATKYYSKDDNYDWFVIFDDEDNEVKREISISSSELNYLYNIENKKRDKTISFDDIDRFADILKVSKDGLVQGRIVLAQVDQTWYYKTEVMNDEDREYVIKLNDSLNNKINDLLLKKD